ncbi:MAG: DinB family protein, partial [Chloroflexota bacterium]|nr:DinB family protein [Chloroflexota bacterium]
RLAALTTDLTPAQLRTPPGPDEWSVNDILAHLRACADMWGGCMARIIAEDRPTLRAINPQTWITQTNYPSLEFQPSLRAFTAQRADLLAALGALPPQGWARSATVTGAGAVLERTTLFYARWLAGHERTHVKQIARMAAALRG